MAERLSLRRSIVLALALALAAAPGAPAAAQGLSDPTRPPQVGDAPAAAAGDATAPSRLQSILFSHGRKVAVVDGQTVQPGDMLGDARVARIGATEIALQRNGEIEVLKLLPGTEKKPVRARQPALRGRHAN